MTNLKIRVKGRNIWQVSSSKLTHVSLDISMLNNLSTGPYLKATLVWVLEFNLPIVFSFGDVLQRHNFLSHYIAKGDSLSAPQKLSFIKSSREAWLAQNTKIIQSVLPPSSFFFEDWNDWLSHPMYPKIVSELKNLVEHNEAHRAALQKDIDRIAGNSGWAGHEKSDSIKKNTIDYMYEEIAVYCIQNELYRALHLYPGGASFLLKSLQNDPHSPRSLQRRKYINFTYRGVGQNSYQDLARWIETQELIAHG